MFCSFDNLCSYLNLFLDHEIDCPVLKNHVTFGEGHMYEDVLPLMVGEDLHKKFVPVLECVEVRGPQRSAPAPVRHAVSAIEIRNKIIKIVMAHLTHYCLTATIVTVLSKFRFQKKKGSRKNFL